MKLTIIYRDNSDHARAVYEFVEMLRRKYPGKTARLLDIDTREGAAEASLRGVMQYPALVLTTYEGRVDEMWQGLPMPTIDTVGSRIKEEQAEHSAAN